MATGCIEAVSDNDEPVPNYDDLSADEQQLYDQIMEYRASNGLPPIPLSNSLTYVAKSHVYDLANNYTLNDTCNMHSWSSKGAWSGCCYTSDHAKASCMWDKPREMTPYSENGYEIAYGGCSTSACARVTAESALNGWKGSSGHNAVILNQGGWDKKWEAIGIGMNRNYAVAWFGRQQER